MNAVLFTGYADFVKDKKWKKPYLQIYGKNPNLFQKYC